MLDRRLPNPNSRVNLADQSTDNMLASGMVFNGDVTIEDIAAYTHGMVQAIYKAYALGPSCVPYEIAVGGETTKLASCIPCTLFMYALGYPPTSIHLGRGESWAPLYEPYSPGSRSGRHERAVIRDLNNTWYENCLKWLIIGLDILDHRRNDMDEFHQSSQGLVMEYIRRNAVLAFKPRDAIERYLLYHNADAFKAFMSARANLDLPDYTVGGVLILDALTIHDSEQARIDRTLC